ncbi:ras protein [Mycena olivaceomarginata]|nr:ras protein [Mycena olivaceomarginata]
MDQWRITLLGDSRVGKTVLAVQFTMNCFTYNPTLEDGHCKQFIVDNHMCFMDLIDTQGQDEYMAVREQWIQEGQGFILVYSITSWSMFNRLEAFHQLMQRLKQGDPIFILVGNKSDNAFERETSAKTAQNMEWVFRNLVHALRHTTDPEPQIPLREKKKKCLIL